jgi:uncharacterized protein involved in type VI secretion and phage assembly
MSESLERTVERLAERSARLFFGKYRAVVTDNNDPEGIGRLMLQVPAVMGETEVGWALPAFPFAGDGHGQVMLPEVGAMVWAEFEAGNPDFPIWSGGFFLGGQMPAEATTTARVIVSVQGHRIVLDDGGRKLTVEHADGALFEMTSTDITLSVGANKMVMGPLSISFNDGVLKIGPAGVSLAQGAMTLGVPPV